MDIMTLAWVGWIYVFICGLLAIRDRMRGIILPKILDFCRIGTRRQPFITKTGVPTREKRWPPPTRPTSLYRWSLYDMIKMMQERARVLGMKGCDTTVKMVHTTDPDSSEIDICVKDSFYGHVVRLGVAQFGKLNAWQVTTANMDCSDIGWDVSTMMFYSKCDMELHRAEHVRRQDHGKTKRGTHDDS